MTKVLLIMSTTIRQKGKTSLSCPTALLTGQSCLLICYSARTHCEMTKTSARMSWLRVIRFQHAVSSSSFYFQQSNEFV